MAQQQREQTYADAVKSVERVQKFDTEILVRSGELGALNFQAAVDPARRLINLFRLIALDAIDDLPVNHVNSVKSQADAIYNIFAQIQSFSLEQQQPKATRDQIVVNLTNQYDNIFNQLLPIISFSLRKSSDMVRLEQEARATIQNLNDRIVEIQEEMGKRKAEADDVLKEIRRVAAEEGVSQQAFYFKQEAESHDALAKTWLTRTAWLTGVLLIYAVATFLIHKIPFIAPQSGYETAQLAISKALVFVSIAFLLVLSARNYSAHRHNAIVNKHRQNGLVTYGALVKSASAGANSDIILTKAADCIFDPQPTGFAKGDGVDAGGMSMINVGTPAIKLPGA